jgi:hypothetical protein
MRKSRERIVRPEKTLIGGVTDRTLIRELFVKRQPHYSLEDACRLTRSAEAEISAAIDEGEFEPLDMGNGFVFSWDDVALLALRRWTPRMIDGALDVVHRDAVPRLNRVRQIQVQLPLYQIRLLHVLAESRRAGFRGRLNASDVLEHELLEVALSVDAAEIETEIPGFRAALQYPYFIPREDDWATAFCRFCGRLSGVAGREMCDDCKLRHEPQMHLGEHGVPELDREER